MTSFSHARSIIRSIERGTFLSREGMSYRVEFITSLEEASDLAVTTGVDGSLVDAIERDCAVVQKELSRRICGERIGESESRGIVNDCQDMVNYSYLSSLLELSEKGSLPAETADLFEDSTGMMLGAYHFAAAMGILEQVSVLEDIVELFARGCFVCAMSETEGTSVYSVYDLLGQ